MSTPAVDVINSYTGVFRNHGPATPWHLPHPRNQHITLCGSIKGGVSGLVIWDKERLDLHGNVCLRCDRLVRADR